MELIEPLTKLYDLLRPMLARKRYKRAGFAVLFLVASGMFCVQLGLHWTALQLAQGARYQLTLGAYLKSRGYERLEAKDMKGAVHFYTLAAGEFASLYNRTGNRDALYELAKLTCLGIGVRRDPEKAHIYFLEVEPTLVERRSLVSVPALKECLEGKRN